MNYYSISEVAKKWGVTGSTVSKYCRDGKIPNVNKLPKSKNGKWQIPETAIKPLFKKEIAILLICINCHNTGLLKYAITQYPQLKKLYAMNIPYALNYCSQMGYLTNSVEEFQKARIADKGFTIMQSWQKTADGIHLLQSGVKILVEELPTYLPLALSFI